MNPLDSRESLEVGSQVAGYRITRLIGHGAMASVYRAEQAGEHVLLAAAELDHRAQAHEAALVALHGQPLAGEIGLQRLEHDGSLAAHERAVVELGQRA